MSSFPVLLPELSPPRVALTLITSANKDFGELQLARFTVSASSASGVQPELPSMPLGSVAAGACAMVHAPGQLNELALAWVGGPAGGGWPVLRRVAINTWTASPTIDLAPTSGPVTSFAAGKGLAASGTAYGGDGYGIVWRRPASNPIESVVAVLDPTGLPVLGPLVVDQVNVPSVIWSGSTYLTATPKPEGIQLARVRPPNGAPGDQGAVENGALIPVSQDMSPGRTGLQLLGTDVIVSWPEKPIAGTYQLSRVRVARVSSDGNLILDSGPNLSAVAPESNVTLGLDGDRVVLTWSVVGDTALADNVPGRSKIFVVRLLPDLKPPGVWAQIPATKFAAHGPPRTISLGAMGELLTVWSGRSASSGLEVVYAARSDCALVAAAPVDGTPCATQTMCGKTAVSKIFKGGQCVDNLPGWKGGLPSCGDANWACNTNAVCNVSGSICHSTWDCATCCQ